MVGATDLLLAACTDPGLFKRTLYKFTRQIMLSRVMTVLDIAKEKNSWLPWI